MLKRVLVANRSEIAVRVIRACRELGIGAVAVHSEADRDALHVRMADSAVPLGPTPSRESYLVQEKVVQAALDTGCDAVHPGYGFLSENPDFADKVAKAGLAFVGPTAAAMRRMGDKTSARREAAAAGVPTAPGSEALKDAGDARREARRIGYPVMLKAAAGGGGIGMRIVRSEAEMDEQLRSATSQARAAFGVPDVFLEKFIERPRHIEVQVLGDAHGHVIHLGERECSIQRRHQKLVEEAPSPALSPAQRAEIGAKAVSLAKRVGYSNAGTMEFLYQDGRFYFNEMNTRLQVEHPVTELVTGIDLVQWQLRIAGGERLTLRQEEVQARGHAFEARINAEDPAHGFAPSPGPVERLILPAGPGIRVDSGLREGWTVPSAYDSMVLKLLVHAGDRPQACDRMLRALDELHIQGFASNKAFHQALFAHPAFRAGDLSTRFLEEHPLQDNLQQAAEAQARSSHLRAAATLAALDAMPGGLSVLARSSRIPSIVAAGARRDRRPE
ncbi:MAG TPA: acetyl-CoA carboxylase biotin carboxylase subunit [Candidatus Thermoplasmatota archaeon]|nr:acetyl-CoA carboxylase biotin carboxylase subunit [Candidatus Thermoplasmatota archaeon]